MIFDGEKSLELYYDSLNPVRPSVDADGNPIMVKQFPISSMVWIRLDEKGRPMFDTGVTLEVQVPGYRTEKVEGRDSLSSDIKMVLNTSLKDYSHETLLFLILLSAQRLRFTERNFVRFVLFFSGVTASIRQ